MRQWVDPPLDTEALGERLTAAGLEVESITPLAGRLEGVVVGEIVAVGAHPGADRLHLCEVADGSGERAQVVCGAPNVRAGMRSAFARIGGRLPDGGKIRASRIRGERSQGMLCSAAELGIGEDADGILDLPADAPVGADLVQWLELDDATIEIGLTPNRGDCLSIAGIAREVAFACGADLHPPAAIAAGLEASIDDTLPIVLEAPDRCPRYVGRIVRNIDPGVSSPLWLSERLRRCGVRPLSLVVDITNYVMLELGQPLHAFDLDRLDKEIRVRKALEGEEIVLLDGSRHLLDAESLVIADASQAVALAGIMGGEGSKVSESTRNVFLEGAWFEPRGIALDARRRSMHTDASHRFERIVSPQLQRKAIERASALLVEIAGGEAGPLCEALAADDLPGTESIRLRSARIDRILGTAVSPPRVVDFLSRLGMVAEEIESTDATPDVVADRDRDPERCVWQVSVPPYRPDIRTEIDLIEEVARGVGFDAIPEKMPRIELSFAARPESEIDEGRIRTLLIDRGYHEALTYSFVDARRQAHFSALGTESGTEDMAKDRDASQRDAPQPIPLANPIASDMGVMRTTMWPGLVHAAARNRKRQQPRVRLFEIGRVFFESSFESTGEQGEARLEQPPMIGGIVIGSVLPLQWSAQSSDADFHDIKNDIEALIALSGKQAQFHRAEIPGLHPARCAAIVHEGKTIGRVGALHPDLAEEFRIKGALLFELRLDALIDKAIPKFEAFSRFPAVRRDLSLLLPEAVECAALHARMIEIGASLADSEILEDVEVFDIYQGKGLDPERKSVSLRLTFRSMSRTLDDAEVDAYLEKTLAALRENPGAVLRSDS